MIIYFFVVKILLPAPDFSWLRHHLPVLQNVHFFTIKTYRCELFCNKSNDCTRSIPWTSPTRGT